MKKAYQYYEEPQGEIKLRTHLRVPKSHMGNIRELDKLGKKSQIGYKYSRNQAILEAIAYYVEHAA